MLQPMGRLERPPVTKEEPSMGIKRLICVIASTLILTACTAWQQGLTPGVTEASPTPGEMDTLRTAGPGGHTTGHPIVRMSVRPHIIGIAVK
jgi:hypothetical protein